MPERYHNVGGWRKKTSIGSVNLIRIKSTIDIVYFALPALSMVDRKMIRIIEMTSKNSNHGGLLGHQM